MGKFLDEGAAALVLRICNRHLKNAKKAEKKDRTVRIVKNNVVSAERESSVVASLKLRVTKEDGATELTLSGSLVGAQIETALEALAEAAGEPESGEPAADLACG